VALVRSRRQHFLTPAPRESSSGPNDSSAGYCRSND
jgi:hypothetical protein